MADAAAAEKKTKLAHLKPKLRQKLKQKRDEEITPEEKQRRAEQKKRRELALKLRAEGRSYDPKIYKKQKRKDSKAAAGAAAGGAAGKHKHAKVKIKSSQRGKAPYHVIILPIAWHQRKEESQRIVAAAEKAEQLLQAAGLTCRIDDGDKFTPGQKMKYWELRGVKVRLEIGPKESLAGSAVLAVAAAAPGQVAQKSSVKVVEPQLSQRVKAALQQLGAMEVDAATAEEQQQQQQGAGSKRQAAAAVGEEEPEYAGEQQQQEPKKKKHKKEKEFKGAPEPAAAVTRGEEQSAKPQKQKKSKEQLKSQLAALVDEQQMAHSIAEQVMQEAEADCKEQQQQQQQVRQQQQQHQSADALDDDFDWAAGQADASQKPKGKGKKQQHGGNHSGAVDGAGLTGIGLAGIGGERSAAKKARKPKVVKF